jgi:Ni,Fe-hydrogenase I cytochrome b subunit
MTEQQNVNQTLEQESEVEINHWVAAGAVIAASVVGYAAGYFGVRWLLSKMNQQD